MKKKLVIRAGNQVRALEAHARVGLVLLAELERTAKKVTNETGVHIDLTDIRTCMELVVDRADDFHNGQATSVITIAGVEVPSDESGELLLTVQCCGGK